MNTRARFALWNTVLSAAITCGLVSAQTPTQPANTVLRPIDESKRVTLFGSVRPALPSAADSTAVDLGFQMQHMILMLQPDVTQQAAFDDLVKQQYDPNSPLYHQFLTPDQFAARFGASPAGIDKVTAWLISHGFRIEEITASHLAIVFSGNAGQVQSAFKTEIRRYTINGEVHHANATDLQIPAALAPVVSGVVKMHDFHSKPFATGLKLAQPQFSNGTTHYLAPADYATIYNTNGLYTAGTDGTGQSIAVIGRSNVRTADIQSFRSQFGLPVNNPIVTIAQGSDPGFTADGDAVEATLDVEWAGAIAPRATVKFVVAASTATADGIDLAALYAVNHNVAPVLTVSFGSCESDMASSAPVSGSGNELTFYNALWQQAASQGISVFVSSGDSGAAGCESTGTAIGTRRAVNGICSSPFSTCVGGTEFVEGNNPGQYWLPGNNAVMGSAISYIPETTWSESGVNGGSGVSGSGGGVSIQWTKPTWQIGLGVPADGHRDVPDVALAAAEHDGYLIFYDGSLSSVGGTSAASPSFASLITLVNQKNGGPQGNANPVLYALALKQAANGAAVFHDITSGNNSVPGVTGYPAGTGYDLATGLGSVNGSLLVNHWSDGLVIGSFALSAAPTAVQVQAGRNASAIVSVTVSSGFSAPVFLSVTGMPGGITASFSLTGFVAPGSGKSILNFGVSAGTVAGTYPITVTATSLGQTQSSVISLTVTPVPLDCLLAATPASISMGLSQATNVRLACTNPQGQFPSALALVVSGQPTGVTATLSTPVITPGTGFATLTIVSGSGAVPGSSTLLLTASATGFNKTLNLPLTLTVPPTFTLNTSAAAFTLAQSAATTIQITSVHTGTFNSSVAFSITGLPFGATAAFLPAAFPAPGDGSTTLTLKMGAITPPGKYVALLTAFGGNLRVTAPLTITVTALPTFTFTVDQPAPTVAQGMPPATINLAISSLTAGFNSAVTFAALNLPSGVTAAFSNISIAAPGFGNSILSLSASSTAALGHASVSLTATGSGVTKTINLLLTVAPPPSFTLQLPISSYNMISGAAFSETLTILAQYGFNSPVTLSVGALPAGISVTFSSNTINGVNGSTVMTIQSGASLPAGNYSISVTAAPPVAASGAAPASQTAILKLLMGTISSTLGATSLNVARSASAATSIITTSNNFTGNVALSISGLPFGVNYTMTPATLPGSGTSALVISAGASAKPGTYAITVRTAAGGSAAMNALMLTID